MFLRSLFFSSIKTTRFYLSQNQSSAAGSQPVAAFWCNWLTQVCEILRCFRAFPHIQESEDRFSPPLHAIPAVWKSRKKTAMTREQKELLTAKIAKKIRKDPEVKTTIR
jgi:hypothetical protein